MISQAPRVFVSHKVIRNIKNSVAFSEDKYEVGGIVLGKKIGKLFIVMKVTLPETDHNQSAFSFELTDDDIHQADIFVSRKFLPLSFLGFWHSHTLGLNYLSSSDKRSINIVANKCGETIAILASIKDEKTILIDMYDSESLKYPFKQIRVKTQYTDN